MTTNKTFIISLTVKYVIIWQICDNIATNNNGAIKVSLSNVASICRQTFNSTQLWETEQGNIFRYIKRCCKRGKSFQSLYFSVKPRFKVLSLSCFFYLFYFPPLLGFTFLLNHTWSLILWRRHDRWKKTKGKTKFFYNNSYTVPMVIIGWRHSNV